MSGAWIIRRLPHIGDELQPKVEELILREIQACPRCLQVFNATGHVPVICEDCGARRDPEWIQRKEILANLMSKNGVAHAT